MFDTGIRLRETLNLTIDDVDITRRTILIPGEINKGKKDRVTFFSIEMARLLHRWLKFEDVIQENDLLFPTQGTNRIIENSNFERNFRGYLKKAKVKIAENSDHEVYLDRPDIVIQYLKTLL